MPPLFRLFCDLFGVFFLSRVVLQTLLLLPHSQSPLLRCPWVSSNSCIEDVSINAAFPFRSLKKRKEKKKTNKIRYLICGGGWTHIQTCSFHYFLPLAVRSEVIYFQLEGFLLTQAKIFHHCFAELCIQRLTSVSFKARDGAEWVVLDVFVSDLIESSVFCGAGWVRRFLWDLGSSHV